MFGDMWELLTSRSDFFADLALEHLAISLSAAAAAIIMGGVIGILISEFRRSSKAVISIVNFLYTIPSISMLGFLIPLSGIGNTTAVIALTIYALLPMVRSTHTGITNVDEAIIEAARGMGSTDAQILWKIKLPLAMPVIMSGIRNMVVMTLALAGIASFKELPEEKPGGRGKKATASSWRRQPCWSRPSRQCRSSHGREAAAARPYTSLRSL